MASTKAIRVVFVYSFVNERYFFEMACRHFKTTFISSLHLRLKTRGVQNEMISEASRKLCPGAVLTCTVTGPTSEDNEGDRSFWAARLN